MVAKAAEEDLIKTEVEQFERDLHTLRHLLSDARLRPIARRLLAEHRSERAAIDAKRKGAVLETGLKEAVLVAITRLRSQFDVNDVIAEMEAAGYEFHAQNRRVGVSKILRVLTYERQIALVSAGRGSTPSVYQQRAK